MIYISFDVIYAKAVLKDWLQESILLNHFGLNYIEIDVEDFEI